MDNWYTIELAEHENKRWEEPTKYGFKLMYSGRISNACVEGTAEEMLAIAEAIEKRSRVSFKRCSVVIDNNSAYFMSPRNSSTSGFCTLAEADELAVEIKSKLTGQ